VSILVAAALSMAATTQYLIVEEPTDYPAACVLTSTHTLNHVDGADITPVVGTMAGSCFDTWSSGKNFAYGWETITLKKVDAACQKRINMFATVDLSPGRAGFLDNCSATPTGATSNPCLHTDGKNYRKYECETDP
jgi:hypothetical protein